MKKIVLNIIVLFAGILLSCNKYLQEDNRSGASYDYLKSQAGFETAVNGVYETMRWGVGGERFYPLTEHGCDWAWEGADGGFKDDFNKYATTLSSTTSLLYEFWGAWYRGITRANTALMLLPDVTGMTDAVKKQREAELKFMRAFFYFDLVQQFGGVPVVTEGNPGNIETDFPRKTAAEVYVQILKDLTEAYPNLESANQHSAQRGRATKWACAHLLSKVYLTRSSCTKTEQDRGQEPGDMANALKYAEEVIKSEKFSLEPNFYDYMDQSKQKGSKEVIWDVQFGANTDDATNLPDGNKMHLYFITRYEDHPGMQRDAFYGRPWIRSRVNYYALQGQLWDRMNDSRFFKTFRWSFRANQPTKVPSWNKVFFVNAKNETTSELLYDPASDGRSGPKYKASTQGTTTETTGDTAILFVPLYFGAKNYNSQWIDSPEAQTNSRAMQTIQAKYSYKVMFIDDNTTQWFPQCEKWVDRQRGPDMNREQGTRNWVRMRLAETYLIAAEAAGRLGQMDLAVQYINVVRKRAAWKEGEEKNSIWVNWLGGDPAKRASSTENNMTVTVSDIQQPTFVDFILDERARELFFELYRWPDLARTLKLVERVKARNKEAAGNIKDYHVLRPIPQNHIDRLIPKPDIKEVQNPGYY